MTLNLEQEKVRASIVEMVSASPPVEPQERSIISRNHIPQWDKAQESTPAVQIADTIDAGKATIIIDDLTTRSGFQFGVVGQGGALLDTASNVPQGVMHLSQDAVDRAFRDIPTALLPADGSPVPFYIEPGTQNIAAITAALRRYMMTEGDAPILALLPVLLDERPDHPEGDFKELRELKRVIQHEAGVLRVRCPGNDALEKELNARLTTQRNLAVTLGAYLHQYAPALNTRHALQNPVIAAVSTATAIAAEAAIPGVGTELLAVMPDTISQHLIEFGIGAAETAENVAGDSTAGVTYAQDRTIERREISLVQASQRRGGRYASGMAVSMIGNTVGTTMQVLGGPAGMVAGTFLVAATAALGTASSTLANEQTHVQAYRTLLADKRIPPSNKMIRLQRQLTGWEPPEGSKEERMVAVEGEERSRVEAQLAKETEKYARFLGVSEASAHTTNRNAHKTVFAIPILSAVIPFGIGRSLAIAGSQAIGQPVVNLFANRAARRGHGFRERHEHKVARQVERIAQQTEETALIDNTSTPQSGKQETIDPLQWAHGEGSIHLHRIFAGYGHVAEPIFAATRVVEKGVGRIIHAIKDRTPDLHDKVNRQYDRIFRSEEAGKTAARNNFEAAFDRAMKVADSLGDIEFGNSFLRTYIHNLNDIRGQNSIVELEAFNKRMVEILDGYACQYGGNGKEGELTVIEANRLSAYVCPIEVAAERLFTELRTGKVNEATIKDLAQTLNGIHGLCEDKEGPMFYAKVLYAFRMFDERVSAEADKGSHKKAPKRADIIYNAIYRVIDLIHEEPERFGYSQTDVQRLMEMERAFSTRRIDEVMAMRTGVVSEDGQVVNFRPTGVVTQSNVVSADPATAALIRDAEAIVVTSPLSLERQPAATR